MKTVHILSIVALVVAFACAAQSQTEQGRWLIGGNAGFNNRSVDGNGITTFTLSPNVGYFVIDNLAVGGQLLLEETQSAKGGFNDKTSFGFTPFVRYYFADAGPARFFGQGRIGFGTEKFANIDAESYFTFGLGAGVDFFLNDNVALEAFLGYDNQKFQYLDDPYNNFGLNIGVQAFIGGGE
jgi:outer membrane protein